MLNSLINPSVNSLISPLTIFGRKLWLWDAVGKIRCNGIIKDTELIPCGVIDGN